MRGAASFHGLHLSWETSGLVSDPVGRLLALCEPLPLHGAERAADVVIRVKARGGRAQAPEEQGFRASFFQGNVRAFARNGEILILAPSARVTIASDGSRIEALVDAETLNERGFVDTTLVIALTVALRHHGLFHLHAGGLVRDDGRRVVVMGDSGSGKTTVTLTLLGPRARHLGDDTLFSALRDGRACLLAFPRPFHVGTATARAFPALGATQADGEPKAHVAREALPGSPILRMDPPHVLLFPRVTRAPATRLVELSKADAFGLALSSCALVAVDGLERKREQLSLLESLLAGARAFEVHLGADWLEDPALAAEIVPWADCPS